jgi:hypothetical protein
VEEIQKSMQADPKYLPEMKIKKVVDEKELGPVIAD